MVASALSSRNYGCRPGVEFRDGIDLPGWEQQSVWGYDLSVGSFFAQLWTNGSSAEAPEVWLSGFGPVYPWPGGVVLELVELLDEDPLAVVRGLGLADPYPRLRSNDEILQRIRELGELGPPTRYIAGQLRALGWTQGLVQSCPGSRRSWAPGRSPSLAQVDAEHHLVTGRVYRGEARDFDAGADEALWWVLCRNSSPDPCPTAQGQVVPDRANTVTVPTLPVSAPDRAWLDVPFAEKDVAKARGARWDGKVKRWYAPPHAIAALDRWAGLPDIPQLLPGEDRSFGAGLFVDLVPSSCWFTNVRWCVIPQDWERVRRMITSRAGNCCEACGQGADRTAHRWLEAHERWAYDDQTGVQALRRLICLCTPCHTTTHFGLAGIKGKDREALTHLRAVTGMTDRQARAHIEEAFALWRARSTRTWTLDLSMLTTAGVTLAPPPESSDRVHIAETTLRNFRS